MHVDQAGDHGPAVAVDALGAGGRGGLCRGTDRDDAVVAHDDARVRDRCRARAVDDPNVVDDELAHFASSLYQSRTARIVR